MANSENLDLKRLDEPKSSTKFNHQIYYQNNFDKIDAAIGAPPSTLTTNAKTLVPAINELKSDKVDKETGKGLSTNDYTTTEKNKLAGIPADTAAQLSGKVDKVTGKGLSTNDFDNTYKQKIDTDIPAQLAQIAKVYISIINPPNGLTKAIPDDQGVDNIPAINAIIDYVDGLGGGCVVIPDGTFYVAPTKLNTIKLKTNVTIISLGKGIIKLKDNAGDFDTLISGGEVNAPKIIGVTIDMNEQNNNTGTQIGFTPIVNLHDTIRCFRTNELEVAHCTILNSAGVNTITNDGVGIGFRNKIHDNKIEWIRGNNSPSWYDNTVVRISRCPFSEVNNNHIFSRSITDNAECAIDLQTEGCSAKGNIISNFTNMFDIVGTELVGFNLGLKLTENVGHGIVSAFNLYLNGNLKDVCIEDNVVSIKQKTWGKTGRGIYYIETASSLLTAENIKQNRNTFRFEDDDRTGDMGEGINISGDYLKMGLEVKDNTIVNAPNFAVNIGNGGSGSPRPIIGLDVSGNKFINCSKAANSVKCIVLLKGDLKNTKLENNFYYDDGDIPYANRLWDSQITTTYDGIKILDKNFNIKNGKLGMLPVPFFIGGAIYNIASQVHAQFENTVVHKNMLPYDIAIMNTGVYKVTSYGTFGWLKGVTGSILKGSRVLTVNNPEGIYPWDKITIGGVLDTYVIYVSGNNVVINDPAPSTVTNGGVQYIQPGMTKLNVNT